MNVFKIGDLKLAAATKEDVVSFIKKSISKVNGYVCVTNTRTAYLASKDKDYCQIQNNSLMTCLITITILLKFDWSVAIRWAQALIIWCHLLMTITLEV